eukprot:gb/GECH01012362.1/.p1 GENE.gb/GECH01012362.1/~~gb/GECH01012362.1/.p1  ORF type:complete len:373 (+),score=100.39 gb/GECH01012362.1/:1-1119(+)
MYDLQEQGQQIDRIEDFTFKSSSLGENNSEEVQKEEEEKQKETKEKKSNNNRNRNRRSESKPSNRIQIKPWQPSTPYLTAIKKREPESQYEEYMKQLSEYQNSPAFFFDCASHFFDLHQYKLGIQILSNVIELELESHQLLRVAGYKFDEANELDLAQTVFEQVLRMRKNEPQSYRDLALVLSKRGDYERALELLWKVVTGRWDSRFSEIEQTALVEINRILNLLRTSNSLQHQEILKNNPIEERFIYPVEFDIRISMAWDTDNTDIDLHVLQPNNEECYYGHRHTSIGGLLSRDFTNGYGPEEYMLLNAISGTYKISAHYYASHQQSLTGGTTVLCALFTDYGRPEKEKLQMLTLRLTSSRERIPVGELTV